MINYYLSLIPVTICLVYIVTSLKLSIDDFKTLSVDTLTFAIFIVLSVFSSYYLDQSLFFQNIITGVIVFFAFYFVRLFFLKTFAKEILAYADITFLSLVPLWLEITHLPLFLILCGAFLFLFDLLSSKRQLPFMPCFFLSLTFCLSMRWFFF